ncbi:metallophosphoesterase family protein [Parapedobacter deserti]|uniref:Metallophosphoesterase family protein n=1 Tax=Parapedobacter deserti TaxID=1912957 RepID=A0ABV7JTA3_9SPHI
MKIALFSDIHANLPALEAMFRQLDDESVDVIYCLGDLVGYHIWPNEVIAAIRARRIPVLMGNHDERVGRLATSGQLDGGANYAYRLIDDAGRAYLKNLPAHIRLEYRVEGMRRDVLLVHGSPHRNDEYVLEDTAEGTAIAMMEEAQASVLCVAHSHLPYHRIVAAAGGERYHMINTGSVGKPKDGDPRGCYVVLDLSGGISDLQVRIERVAYDVHAAAEAILQSPLPNELADRLLNAY